LIAIAYGYNFQPSEIKKMTAEELKFWGEGLKKINEELNKHHG
jgi:hypothetical protein